MSTQASVSSLHRLDLPERIYHAIEDYTRLAGVTPSIYDLPIIVDAPMSTIRPHVETLLARGHVDGDWTNLVAVNPPYAPPGS